MDAIKILKKDHDEIREYFKQFEEAGPRAKKKKQAIAEKAIKEIHSHSRLEEQIFYPAVRKKGSQEVKDLVLEGIEEHRLADFVMERIQSAGPDDERFDARFKVLTETVTHHLKEEERQLFPESKKFLGEDLERLGDEMEALKKQLEG